MCLLASVSKCVLLYLFKNAFSSDLKGRDKDGKRKERSVKKRVEEGCNVVSHKERL